MTYAELLKRIQGDAKPAELPRGNIAVGSAQASVVGYAVLEASPSLELSEEDIEFLTAESSPPKELVE